MLGIRYFFKYTTYGTNLKAISENNNLAKSIGIKTNQISQMYFAILFLAIVALARLLLNQSTIKTGD